MSASGSRLSGDGHNSAVGSAAPESGVAARSIRVAALAAIAVGIPIAFAYAAGAMQIPRVDDWAFSRIAYNLESTGHFHLIGWGEMTMIGHELWGVPFVAMFGRSLTALHWAGALAAAIGLVPTFCPDR